MNDILITAIISAVLGLISAFFVFKSNDKNSDQNAIVQLRQDLFKQIEIQEKRISLVEKALEKWRTRYWKLYTLHVKMIAENKLSDLPPNFHDEEGHT